MAGTFVTSWMLQNNDMCTDVQVGVMQVSCRYYAVSTVFEHTYLAPRIARLVNPFVIREIHEVFIEIIWVA